MAISTLDDSPFHAGEQALQERFGVREQMETFGRRVIRDHMPQQHQDFYQQLPFVFVGHADNDGWPWASIVVGEPGFMQAETARDLSINSQPISGDPLARALQHDTRLGFLGMEPSSRRRNRLSGQVNRVDQQGFGISIHQAFGNCPQYIQSRQFEVVNPDSLTDTNTQHITELDEQAIALIESSDTFFVASCIEASKDPGNANNNYTEGADVSHRGGKPGFVKVEKDGVLTIPDYLGNNHFNTLGNFLLNPRAGLLFIDWENQHLLTLTGSVEILWDDEATQHFDGAQRFWRFRLEHGAWLKNSLPLKTHFESYSANTELTGTWDQAASALEAEKRRHQWQDYRIEKVVPESATVKSFYLKPESGQLAHFEAGQFLTLQFMVDGKQHVRTYTVSSAPGEAHYRISVKREAAGPSGEAPGLISNYLHDHATEGQQIKAKAPSGDFCFKANEDRPAVLLAAGIGITPMVSMVRHAILDRVRTRHAREIVVIATARNNAERAFYSELQHLAQQSGGFIQVVWCLTAPESELPPGEDYSHAGRMDQELLQAILPLADYDFYLCGPAGYMQHSYDLLRHLGVADKRIAAEAFGPASMQRDLDEAQARQPTQALPAAEQAIVTFVDPQGRQLTEQQWQPADGTLLELAEAHGLEPNYGCRTGSCGSCKSGLQQGSVSYSSQPSAKMDAGEVLLCCTQPAAGEGEELPAITIQLS